MSTVVTTTRFWESEDSAESINNRFRVFGGSGPQATNSNSRKELKVNSLTKDQDLKKWRKKSSKSLSRTNFLAAPKRNIKNDLVYGMELNGVKRSALLYEITDRTNKLARPKSIIGDFGTKKKASSHISNPKIASERVSELSRPKSFYNPPTKPPGYIAPSALRAVATQRILELATPRKKRSPRLPKKEKKKKKNISTFLNAPCSPRISYLARPKNSGNCSRIVQKNFLKRSIRPAADNYPPPWYY